jgi:hypothetical protein
LCLVVVALLVFFAFGPVGLGNGPLQAASANGGWGPVPHGDAHAAIHVQLMDTGSPALLQGAAVLGASGYPRPRLLRVLLQPSDGCQSTLGPVVSAGCGGPEVPATGATVPGASGPALDHSRDKDLVLVLSLPLNNCAVVTAIVVHYRVGWRHFTSTTPERFVACGSGTPVAYAHEAFQTNA